MELFYHLNFEINWIIIALVASLALAFLLCFINYYFSTLLSSRRAAEQRFSAYECGFTAFDTGEVAFDVRYYLIAILFLLFDIELLYLFPFAVLLPVLTSSGFWAVELFMFLLLLGFIFEYCKKAIQWQTV